VRADVCEIYSDVTGVFTADPRIVPAATKLPLISHEEMLEMAAMGSRVLALRSVEFARNHDVELHVRSSFRPEEGTWITKETPRMEQAIVSGIAHRSDEAKITVSGVKDQPGVAAKIMTALADRMVNVDTIIQNVSDHGAADVSFTVPLDELKTAKEAVEGLRDVLEFRSVTTDDQLGKVSLIGAGMRSNPGVAAKMFRTLAAEGINIQMIDTSTIRLTVVIDRREVERAVRCLHDAFDLGSEAARRADV
jgi:aspartate kinase